MGEEMAAATDEEMDEDGRVFLSSQTLDQDLWVVGDRSREEGVPSRLGRGIGMCPLIRLGNCGGRERGRELARRGRTLSESCFPLRNCSIVTALVSCFFFFFFSLYLFLFGLCPLHLHNRRSSQQCLCTKNPVYSVCVCVCVCVGVCGVVRCMYVRFSNEEQLSNQSALFKPAPLGSNRKYSQDFLSSSQALKQDTSARPAH